MSEFTKSTKRKLRGIGRTAYNRSRFARRAMDLFGRPMPHLEGLNVKIFLYDPLAHAGLYKKWDDKLDDDKKTGEDSSEFEMVPEGLQCVIKNSDDEEVASWTFKPEGDDDNNEGATLQLKDNIDPEKTYKVEFPTLISGEEPSADLTCWVVNGKIVNEQDLNKPRKRNTFNVKGHGEYRFRIWLRPKAIVLHWTAGGYDPGNSYARTSYHFLINGDGVWMPGGWFGSEATSEWNNVTGGPDYEVPSQDLRSAGDNGPRSINSSADRETPDLWTMSWRMWWHNLVIAGAPEVNRRSDVKIDLNRIGIPFFFNRTLQYPNESEPQERRFAISPTGYFTHAGGFNTNSLGVTFCGMNIGNVSDTNFKPRGDHKDNSLLTYDQMKAGIREVAELCKRFKLDPEDPNDLCTHYEVDALHRAEGNKWDITWLPTEMQNDYHDYIDKMKKLEEPPDKFEGIEKNEDTDRYELCEEGSLSEEEESNRKYKRYSTGNEGIPLGDWESEHNTNNRSTTDRVSDYLRVLVKKEMDD